MASRFVVALVVRGTLAGGVAHDFKNLLTVMTAYSQLLPDDFSTRLRVFA